MVGCASGASRYAGWAGKMANANRIGTVSRITDRSCAPGQGYTPVG